MILITLYWLQLKTISFNECKEPFLLREQTVSIHVYSCVCFEKQNEIQRKDEIHFNHVNLNMF